MKCEEFENQTGAYLDGELSKSEAAACDEHLSSCEKCSSLIEEFRLLESSLKQSTAPLPDEAYWSGFDARLNEKIEKEKAKKLSWNPFMWFKLASFRWAAGLLILLLVFVSPALKEVFAPKQYTPGKPAEKAALKSQPEPAAVAPESFDGVAKKEEIPTVVGPEEQPSPEDSKIRSLKSGVSRPAGETAAFPTASHSAESESIEGGKRDKLEIAPSGADLKDALKEAEESGGADKTAKKVLESKTAADENEKEAANKPKDTASFFKEKKKPAVSQPPGAPAKGNYAGAKLGRSVDARSEAPKPCTSVSTSVSGKISPESGEKDDMDLTESKNVSVENKKYLASSEAVLLKIINMKEDEKDLELLRENLKDSKFIEAVSADAPSDLSKHKKTMIKITGEVMAIKSDRISGLKTKVVESGILETTRELRK